MATDSAELLPCGCPFCGAGAAIPMTATKAGFSGVEVMRDSLNRPFVWCGTCGAQARWENTEAEAIAAWNTRAPVPASPPVEGEGRAVAAIEATGLLAGDEARDAARAAISALSKPRVSREEIAPAAWQAIETAPKDGTWIMGWAERDSSPYRISWGTNHDGRLTWCTNFGSFYDGYITHWVPLPEPCSPEPRP